MNSGNSRDRLFEMVFWCLGVTTFASVFIYGVGNLVSMPVVSPDGFIPKSLDAAPSAHSWLAIVSPICVLLYALSFLPIVVLFSIAKFRENPRAMVIAGSLISLSLVLELVNALPLTSLMIARVRPQGVPAEVLLYLGQMDAVRFLALDAAGFSLAYVGLLFHAFVFRRSQRWFSGLILASVVLFAANVPFLWIYPPMAVILMAASIIAFSLLPLFMVRMCAGTISAACQQASTPSAH